MGVASFTLRPLGKDLPVWVEGNTGRDLGKQNLYSTGIRSQNRPAKVVAISTELSIPTYARIA